MNYNKVIARAKGGKYTMNPSVNKEQVLGMYNVAQDMNTPREPQLAIKSKGRRIFI